MTNLASILIRHGIIDAAAIEDADGYDGGRTELAVSRDSDEIQFDTTILNFIEAHQVDHFRNGNRTVTLLLHFNPMAFHSGEGEDLRSAVADLIAKNPNMISSSQHGMTRHATPLPVT